MNPTEAIQAAAEALAEAWGAVYCEKEDTEEGTTTRAELEAKEEVLWTALKSVEALPGVVGGVAA